MTRTISKDAPRSSASAKAAAPTTRRESNRETVESIVVAVILALLIRGFEAEAFVIPTGSMAPTLMGRHKEVYCEDCEQLFAVNASVEEHPGGKVKTGLCSNCRRPAALEAEPSFKGDRILVMKFPFDLPGLPGSGNPARWDVVVFKYPGKPEQNYIKRLVGLPGEELQILAGDLFIRSSDAETFLIARKPLHHQQAMQMLVYDDAHRPRSLADRPEWRRWSPVVEGLWSEKPEAPGVFAVNASSSWAELEYRNLVPDPNQWEELLANRDPGSPKRTLISDFYAYNSNSPNNEGRWERAPHWVGDLTINCRADVASPTGQIRLELVRGGVPYRCEIDVESGKATLFAGDEALAEPAVTPVHGAGSYDLGFANVDGRLTLWVNGRTPFGDGVAYDDGRGERPVPTEKDLHPVTVAARGCDAKISRLLLRRDIYYTQDPQRTDYGAGYGPGFGEFDRPAIRSTLPNDPRGLRDAFADPTKFAALAVGQGKRYKIAPGKFMMMGDNSPESSDSRAWEPVDRDWDTTGRQSWEVPESMILGKAFFVYWPHGKPIWPDFALSRDFHIPFRPYVERMRWIR